MCGYNYRVKVILFANTDWYLYHYRLPLAQAMQARGWEILALSPPGDYTARLQQAGIRWRPFPFSRRGKNPLSDLDLLRRLVKIYRAEQPDAVHHFTIKPVLYGSLAARWLKIPTIVNAIPGLGHVFIDESIPGRALRRAVMQFYRFALAGTQVIFQNPDDQALFSHYKLVREGQHYLIRGSGVDVERLAPLPEPQGDPVAALPARLLWPKGVAEFVAAAQRLKSEGLAARFALIGRGDPDSPQSVPDAQLHAWADEGAVEWWGWTDEVFSIYERAHIICLPTYYGEGVPRSLLEAAACGRPIVATDQPGCREIVQHGRNGLLVEVQDIDGLADALRTLITDPLLRQQMGGRGRALVVEKFSVDQVIRETLAVYTARKKDYNKH
jgi:glycosyltransferase involved in cell wall biosynthesis